MRKVISFMSVFIVIYLIFIPKVQSEKEERIPDEAIRLRILANSNSEADQQMKLHVRDRVNYYVSKQVQHSRNKVEVREIIESNIPEIKRLIAETIQSDDFTVYYGTDVTFPKKTYGDYVYPAGQYEALLISIGEGNGDNWWCVLFPPLCFVEFTSDEAELASSVSDSDDVNGSVESDGEWKFFLWEWITSL